MKLKLTLGLATLLFLLNACFSPKEENEKDPFAEIPYGTISFKNAKEKFLSNPDFSEPSNDSTEFQFYFLNSEVKIPVTIELNPDDYNFGLLREIRIELDGDTVYYSEPEYWPGNGPRLKSEIDIIVQKYKNMYGLPDSILIKEEEVNSLGQSDMNNFLIAEIRANIRGSKSINPQLDSIKEKSLIWELEDFIIDFYLPKPYSDEYQNNLPVYRGARILYSMKNYDQTLTTIKDSIRNSLKPNEIISVDLGEVKWIPTKNEYERKIDVEIKGFTRNALEITEGFRALRYDIKIIDQFNKTIGEIKNLTYEFDGTVLRYPEGALNFWMNSPHLIQTYNINSSDFDSLEKARQYAKNFKVRAVANVKAVVLGGGEVIE